MLLSDEHRMKAQFSMYVTDDWIFICLSDIQLKKATDLNWCKQMMKYQFS